MMTEIVDPSLPKWKQRVRIPLYQWIAVNVALLVILAGGGWGTVSYWSSRSAEEARRAELMQYSIDQAVYANARDERTRCEQRVDGREDIRGVLLGISIRLGADNDTIDIVQEFLDEEYEAFVLSDCPPIPVPPEPPKL